MGRPSATFQLAGDAPNGDSRSPRFGNRLVDRLGELAAEFFGLFVIALHFSNKATKAKPAANVTASAVGLDINNNGGTTIETSIPTNFLKQVFKHLEQGNA